MLIWSVISINCFMRRQFTYHVLHFHLISFTHPFMTFSHFLYIYIYIYLLSSSHNSYVYEYIYIKTLEIHIHTHINEAQLNIWQSNQGTHMECDQMRLIFQHSPLLVVHTLLSSVMQCLDPIDQKSHQQQIWWSYELSAYLHIYIYK